MKRGWGLVGVFVAVASIISLFLTLVQQAAAVGDSIWTGSGQVTIVDEGEITAEQANQLNCSVMTKGGTRLKSSTRDLSGNLNLSEANKTFVAGSAQCYYQNKLGLFTKSGNLWATPGSDRAVRVYANPTTATVPVPGDSTAIIMTSPSAVAGKNYSINHNLPVIGRLDTEGSPKELIWRLNSMSDYIKYSDGSLVNFDSADFSSNGRYMVTLLQQKVLVRVDLQTQELVPIGSASYGTGTTPSYAISNDGNYVLTNLGGLKLYDLSGCQNKYETGQWPNSLSPTSSFAGCASRDIFAQSKTALPAYEKVGHMRFSPNGQLVKVEVNWRDSAGALHWHRMVIKSSGYTEPQGYLAMGDSFASGEGDTQGGTFYEPGTDEYDSNGKPINLCHLSRRSYPYLVANAAGYLTSTTGTPRPNGLFHSVACSGAKTENTVLSNQYSWVNTEPLRGWLPGYIGQINYFEPDEDRSRELFRSEVLTISAGGNDVGFIDHLLPCLKPGTCELAQADATKRGQLASEMAALKPKLVETYKKVKQSANNARIYVLGYPQIVQETGGTCAVNVLLNDEERVFVNKATHYFNQVIQAAANEAGAFFVGVEDILGGVNLCSGATDFNTAVNGVTAGNDRPIGWLKLIGNVFGNESYHPNQLAQPLYRDKLLSLTTNLSAAMPAATINFTPTPEDYFGSTAQSVVANLNNPAAVDPLIATRRDMVTIAEAGEVTVNIGGFQPNTVVQVELYSTPVLVGSFTTDQYGNIQATISAPELIEQGFHELHVKGTSLLGEQVEFYQPVVLTNDPEDVDGDGILDINDPCPFITPLGQDVDQDGLDDACDPDLATPLLETEPDFGHEPSPAKPEEFLPVSVVAGSSVSAQTTNSASRSNQSSTSNQVAVLPTETSEPAVLAVESGQQQNPKSEQIVYTPEEKSYLLWLILAGVFVLVLGGALYYGNTKNQ